MPLVLVSLLTQLLDVLGSMYADYHISERWDQESFFSDLSVKLSEMYLPFGHQCESQPLSPLLHHTES